MSIRIVTDSNCDLPQGMVDDYGITVVPMYINIGTESYLDGVTMSRQEFYEGLPHFDSHPMTSVPGPGTFIETFDELAAEGATEILAIHVAGSLSAMVNSARLAAEEWDRLPVTVFDSGNLTLGTGLQALAAARAAAEGRTMDEIVSPSPRPGGAYLLLCCAGYRGVPAPQWAPDPIPVQPRVYTPDQAAAQDEQRRIRNGTGAHAQSSPGPSDRIAKWSWDRLRNWLWSTPTRPRKRKR